MSSTNPRFTRTASALTLAVTALAAQSIGRELDWSDESLDTSPS